MVVVGARHQWLRLRAKATRCRSRTPNIGFGSCRKLNRSRRVPQCGCRDSRAAHAAARTWCVRHPFIILPQARVYHDYDCDVYTNKFSYIWWGATLIYKISRTQLLLKYVAKFNYWTVNSYWKYIYIVLFLYRASIFLSIYIHWIGFGYIFSLPGFSISLYFFMDIATKGKMLFIFFMHIL